MRIPQPGQTFEGKFEIVRRLGQGGFANVFLAIDHDIGREVALKVLVPEHTGYRDGVEARFMQEARVLASLQDPHTIRLFSYGRAPDGLLYMVFQYVPGQDLSDVLARGPLPLPVALHITQQVLMALDEAHTAGVLHRDLKPANIFIHQHLGDNYAVKLLDFGIAKIDPAVGGMDLTKTGVVVGTPRYMAPEQVFGEPFGPPADLYAVGLLLHEMLTGQPAIQGDSQAILAWRLAEREHIVPSGVAGPAVTAVLQRLLALKPEQRYASARDARAALDRAAALDANGPITAPAPAVQAPRTSSRAAIGVVVGAIGVGAAAVWAMWPEPEPQVTIQPTITQVDRSGLVATDPIDPAPATTSTEPDAGSASDVAPDVAAARSGCGRTLTRGDFSFEVEGWSTFAVLPNDYDENTKYPIAIAFHPELIKEDKYSQELRLRRLREAGELDFIVAFVPSGTQWTPWERVDELEWADATLEAAQAQFCVDDQRIFALGHSHGAEMARRFACHRPVSGLALTGYLPTPSVQWCADPPPTLWGHGVRDDIMPYDGSDSCTSGNFQTGEEFTAMLSAAHQCEPQRRSTEQCQDYQCAAAPLQICLTDGGHHLSRNALYLINYTTCTRAALALDESTIWAFFAQYGRLIGE